MKIKWLAHSSFLITSDQGTRILTDPYAVGQGITYAPIKESADIVTISHEHFDHNNPAVVKGNPQIVKGEGAWNIKGIEIRGVPAFHDDTRGSQRGKDTIFCFKIDGLKVCHLGDLGQLLTHQQTEEIGPVDVLLVPVGGYFTIDAKQADTVRLALQAKIAIPMHFKTPQADFPLAGVDDFIGGKDRVQVLKANEISVSKADLAGAGKIMVLQHAL